MIKNYGLFWKREAVHWNPGGRRGNPRGHLIGSHVVERRQQQVNFRDQVGIYCLYDDNFRLLYTGQAGFGNATLFGRLRSHTNDHLSERWTKFSWFGLKGILHEGDGYVLQDQVNANGLELNEVLNSLEGIIIVSAEPPLNRRGPNFGAAQKFSQYRDLENVYPSQSDMIKDIWDSVPAEEDEAQAGDQ